MAVVLLSGVAQSNDVAQTGHVAVGVAFGHGAARTEAAVGYGAVQIGHVAVAEHGAAQIGHVAVGAVAEHGAVQIDHVVDGSVVGDEPLVAEHVHGGSTVELSADSGGLGYPDLDSKELAVDGAEHLSRLVHEADSVQSAWYIHSPSRCAHVPVESEAAAAELGGGILLV